MVRLALALVVLALAAAWVGLLYLSARAHSAPMTVAAALLGVAATLIGQRLARW